MGWGVYWSAQDVEHGEKSLTKIMYHHMLKYERCYVIPSQEGLFTGVVKTLLAVRWPSRFKPIHKWRGLPFPTPFTSVLINQFID